MKGIRETFKKYFIPHEKNDHQPHLLRLQTVVFVLVIAIACESFFLFGSSYLAPRSRLFGIILMNALVDETNANRSANDIPSLRIDPLLEVAAQEKANDMVANNYFAHTSPQGVTPWYWFMNAGYHFTYAGENLAVNFSDSQDVTNAWMNSPDHRANILNNNFTDIGIATAQGEFQGRPAVYVVELFGAPSITPIAEALPPAGHPAASAVPKPITKASKAPVIVASGAPQESFVAVKGVEIESISGTAPISAPPVSAQDVVPQSNMVQKAFSDPRRIVDDIYLAIIALFSVALILNVFIKIRIQHPSLIFGGALVILAAGLFVVLNQHSLLSAAIL